MAFATTKASDSPDGKTGEHGSAAAAAAAANANATGAADGGTDEGEEAEVELGGQGLVEAVFRGMFPDNFQEVVPVRNHKASTCIFRHICASMCACVLICLTLYL